MRKTRYNYKQVIVVRSDIKMSKGKMAVQVAHAAVSAFFETFKKKPGYCIKWLEEGQPKIVLRANDENDLQTIYRKAIDNGLITVLIIDSGLTELERGTKTCVAIGPDETNKIDSITGHLKLI